MAIDQKILVPVVAISAILMASFPLFNEYILTRCETAGSGGSDCPACPSSIAAAAATAADCPECQDCMKFAPKCPKCPLCKSVAATTALARTDAARKFTAGDKYNRLLYVGYSDVSIWGLKSFESYYHNILPQKNQQFKFYEPVSDMALYAERDLGGWNNIRMGYEVEVCLAYKYRRRMGMPRKARFYLVDTPAISIFDFYDEEHFKAVIPTVDYYGADGKLGDSDKKIEGEVFPVPKEFSITDQVKTRKSLDELPVDKHWHFADSRGGGTRIFEQYTELVDFQPKEVYIKLIHQAFRMRKDIVDKTIAMLLQHGLQPYGYNAIHVRRNEFQYKDVRHVSIQKIFDHIKPYIRDQPLLIVSDEYSADLIKIMERAASRVVMWKCDGKCAPDQLSIDMLAGVPAKRFFGSPLSTFSAGIAQWRHRCHPATQIQHTMPYTQDMAALPSWGRPGEVVMPVVTNIWKDIGYEKLTVHPEVRRILEDLYIDERQSWKGLRLDHVKVQHGSRPILKALTTEMAYKMDALVKPMLEQWVGFELAPTSTHSGVLEYQDGTTTSKNRETGDRVVSVAFVIRDAAVPWELNIRSRAGTAKKVSFKDGDMFFFAGQLEKSRTKPLKGKFAVAYSHFLPKDWNDCATLACNYCGKTCDSAVRT